MHIMVPPEAVITVAITAVIAAVITDRLLYDTIGASTKCHLYVKDMPQDC